MSDLYTVYQLNNKANQIENAANRVLNPNQTRVPTSRSTAISITRSRRSTRWPAYKALQKGCGEQRRLYQQILDEGTTSGLFRPVIPTGDIAQNLISLEDGYGLGLATGNHDYDFEQARQLILTAAAHWMDCPDLLADTGRRGQRAPVPPQRFTKA